MQAKNSGFTLMEVIGVLAVIAIIAAVATPQIFSAIQDAKVTGLVQEANNLKAVVARYHKDTGTWPRHIPTRTEPHLNQLMVNASNAAGNPIPGWNGPYLESEMTNSVNPNSYMDLVVTNNVNWACDLNGDGATDGTFITWRVDNVPDSVANSVSDLLDGDGEVTTGNGDWRKAGRVKRYGGTHAHILLMCLGRA